MTAISLVIEESPGSPCSLWLASIIQAFTWFKTFSFCRDICSNTCWLFAMSSSFFCWTQQFLIVHCYLNLRTGPSHLLTYHSNIKLKVYQIHTLLCKILINGLRNLNSFSIYSSKITRLILMWISTYEPYYRLFIHCSSILTFHLPSMAFTLFKSSTSTHTNKTKKKKKGLLNTWNDL